MNTPTMKLEVVILPVTDIDRAKHFYAEQVGFHVDHDMQPTPTARVLQLTPVGSACSVVMTKGLPADASMVPGIIKGLHLVVDDVVAVRDLLLSRGVEVAEVLDMGGILYAEFSDPDGNSWLLQQIPPHA